MNLASMRLYFIASGVEFTNVFTLSENTVQDLDNLFDFSNLQNLLELQLQFK